MSALHNGIIKDELVRNEVTALKENAAMNCQENSEGQDVSSPVATKVLLSSQTAQSAPDSASLPGKDGLTTESVCKQAELTVELEKLKMQSEKSSEMFLSNSTAPIAIATASINQDFLPEFSNPLRPESLSLPNPSHNDSLEQSRSSYHRQAHDESCVNGGTSDTSSGVGASEPIPIWSNSSDGQCSRLSSSLPQGTITRKGDMIQFVADNLLEKIKQSSPMSNADTGHSNSRRSSERSIHSFSSSTSFATSSGVSRSPSSQFQQSPDDIPPIDATAVLELENHARKVADNLDHMMGNIRNNLHKMSAITIGCQDAYKRSVDITCDSVDASIKSMYALMAKCEELSAVMGPVEQLAAQIKEIKRILDLFETQLSEK